MQDEVIRLSTLEPQIEKLKSQNKALKEKQQGPMFLEADLVAFTNHFKQVYDDMKGREKQLQTSKCSCLLQIQNDIQDAFEISYLLRRDKEDEVTLKGAVPPLLKEIGKIKRNPN